MVRRKTKTGFCKEGNVEKGADTVESRRLSQTKPVGGICAQCREVSRE